MPRCRSVANLDHFSYGTAIGRPEKWSRSATLQERGKLRPFVTWDSQKNGREVPRYRREAFLDRFIGESPEKMVAKCLAVAAWHFATKITFERAAPVPGEASASGARIWRSACLGRTYLAERLPAGARNRCPCLPRRPFTPPAWGNPRDSKYPGESSSSGSGLPCNRCRSARRRTPRPGSWAECRSHGRTSSRAPGAS